MTINKRLSGASRHHTLVLRSVSVKDQMCLCSVIVTNGNSIITKVDTENSVLDLIEVNTANQENQTIIDIEYFESSTIVLTIHSSGKELVSIQMEEDNEFHINPGKYI